MTKYFTKYLPVEDEIKEGDKIYFKHDGSRGLMNERGLPKWVIDKCKERGYKTGKLFICTKDIKVGDKVVKDASNWKSNDFDSWGRGEGEAEVLEVIPDIDLRWEGGRAWEDLKQILKVVGEVSPKAEWVKEGHTWGEDFYYDCFPRHEHDDDGKTIWHDEYDLPDPNRKIPIYNIKGPCGHYH